MAVTEAELAALDIAALEAAEFSYSPYSQFPVGAAVLVNQDIMVTGCNIENASYGLSICAERCALFGARGAGYIVEGGYLALSTTCPSGDLNDPDTLMSCGACRQVMKELLAPDAVISIIGAGRFSIDELLPRAFHM